MNMIRRSLTHQKMAVLYRYNSRSILPFYSCHINLVSQKTESRTFISVHGPASLRFVNPKMLFFTYIFLAAATLQISA